MDSADLSTLWDQDSEKKVPRPKRMDCQLSTFTRAGIKLAESRNSTRLVVLQEEESLKVKKERRCMKREMGKPC